MRTRHKNLTVAVIAGVLALILGVAWYAIAQMMWVPVVSDASSAPETGVERLKSQNESMPQTPSKGVAAASTRYAAFTDVVPSGSSGKIVGTRSGQEVKRKIMVAYQKALECRKYVYAKKQLSDVKMPNVYNAHDVGEIRKQLNEADETLLRNQDRCEGVNVGTISDELFERSLRAGLQGDLGAQSCFVAGTLYETIKLRRDAVQEQQFLANAPRFLEHGIQQGYWPLVSVAVGRLLDSSNQLPPWLRALPEPDPYRVYRSVRLVYYRSDSRGTPRLEAIMKLLEDRGLISPQQVEMADRWAQHAHQNRFADTEPLDIEHTNGCQ